MNPRLQVNSSSAYFFFTRASRLFLCLLFFTRSKASEMPNGPHIHQNPQRWDLLKTCTEYFPSLLITDPSAVSLREEWDSDWTSMVAYGCLNTRVWSHTHILWILLNSRWWSVLAGQWSLEGTRLHIICRGSCWGLKVASCCISKLYAIIGFLLTSVLWICHIVKWIVFHNKWGILIAIPIFMRYASRLSYGKSTSATTYELYSGHCVFQVECSWVDGLLSLNHWVVIHYTTIPWCEELSNQVIDSPKIDSVLLIWLAC